MVVCLHGHAESYVCLHDHAELYVCLHDHAELYLIVVCYLLLRHSESRPFSLTLLSKCSIAYNYHNRSVPERHRQVAGTLGNQQTAASLIVPLHCLLTFTDEATSKQQHLSLSLSIACSHSLMRQPANSSISHCSSPLLAHTH